MMILLWKPLIVIVVCLLKWTCAFTFPITTTNIIASYSEARHLDTRIYGVLSRNVIVENSQGSKKHKGNMKNNAGSKSSTAATPQPISKGFLVEATDEAMLRQELILKALENERTKYDEMLLEGSISENIPQESKQYQQSSKPAQNQNKRTVENKIESIDERHNQILQKVDQLKALKQQISRHSRKDLTMEALRSFKKQFETLGFASILQHDPDTWKIRLTQKTKEYGRPEGFDGLIFYTPRGVPILVGRPKAHKDETLRRIAQGADLWFQVEDYQGSRVLLRSSLQRGLKDSKECKQMAANLAARYSDWYYYHSDKKGFNLKRIPIMYCDSRKVAKRGSGIGRMNHRKKLGRMYGDPTEVEELTSNEEIP